MPLGLLTEARQVDVCLYVIASVSRKGSDNTSYFIPNVIVSMWREPAGTLWRAF